MRERKKEGEEAEIGTTFTSGSLRMHVRDDEDRLKEKYITRRKNERER